MYGHVVANDATGQWVYSWHVPLFFFLSGWFWRRGRTIADELRVRSRSLLVPYGFWLAFDLALLSLLGIMTPEWLTATLLGGTSARGIFAAFWFVTALFWASLLARLLDRMPVWVAWVVAVAGTAASTLLPIADLPLAIGHAFPGLLFMLFGSAASRVRMPWWMGLVLIGLSAVAISTLSLERFDMKPLQLGTPIVGIAVAVAISWGLTICFSPVRAKWVEVPVSAGITVVLLHTLVLFFVAQSGIRTLFVLAIVLSATWAVAIALRFTPMSFLASGQPRLRLPRARNA